MINAKRFNIILTIFLALQTIGAVALTVYANIWLTEKADGLVELKLDTVGLKEQQSVNLQAAKDLLKYESTRVLLEKIVPKSKDQAKTISELLKIADEVGVTISSMTFPASELGNSGSTKTVVGTTPTVAAANTTVVTQAKPVANIPGLLGIEISLSQIDNRAGESGDGVSYEQLLGFLEAVERNRRTMQIKTLQVLPIRDQSGRVSGYSLSLTMNIFVKP